MTMASVFNKLDKDVKEFLDLIDVMLDDEDTNVKDKTK